MTDQPNMFHEGKQWGVMFHDGSVMHRWSGRTQRQRAEEEWKRCRELYAPDNIRLVYREGLGEEWKEESRMKIIVRDGKELDVDLTLEMTQEALDTWLLEGWADPPDPSTVRGLGLALEAALIKLRELDRSGRRRRLLG